MTYAMETTPCCISLLLWYFHLDNHRHNKRSTAGALLHCFRKLVMKVDCAAKNYFVDCLHILDVIICKINTATKIGHPELKKKKRPKTSLKPFFPTFYMTVLTLMLFFLINLKFSLLSPE